MCEACNTAAHVVVFPIRLVSSGHRAHATENMRMDKRPVPFDPSGPPLFEIKSRDWWFKVLEMLCHNWALIEEGQYKSVTVYFFHDQGGTNGRDSGASYTSRQRKGRCAIVDSLEFETVDDAVLALGWNGFQRLAERPGPWDGEQPHGNFFDARATEEGIYSKAGYWTD